MRDSTGEDTYREGRGDGFCAIHETGQLRWRHLESAIGLWRQLRGSSHKPSLYRWGRDSGPNGRKGCDVLYEFANAAKANYHKKSGLKKQILCLTGAEARRPRSRCWQGQAPSSGAWEELVPGLSATVWYFLGLSATPLLSSRGTLPVCISVSKFPLQVRTPVMLGQGPSRL